MSNFRGGAGPELYYSASIAGTALNTFTTEASLMGLYPPLIVPPTYFDKTGIESSSMRIRAYFVFGDTSTAPTFAVGVRLTTTNTFSATNGWLSTALTPSSVSQTIIHGQLDFDITLRTLASAASSTTLTGDGIFTLAPATVASGTIPVQGTADTFTTFDSTSTTGYYFWISCVCGTSNAANTAQLVTLKAYLDN